jgi:HTH-type transcriptional regulator / antitoxin HigA
MTTKYLKTSQAGADRDSYLELVKKLPLRRLRNDEELDKAVEMLDSLIVRGDLDAGERDYLDVLTDIIERYEAHYHPMPAVSDDAMLRHLIEAKGVTQAQLATDTGIAESTVSEVLAGKRGLTRKHIGILASYFHVSPTVFNFSGD